MADKKEKKACCGACKNHQKDTKHDHHDCSCNHDHEDKLKGEYLSYYLDENNVVDVFEGMDEDLKVHYHEMFVTLRDLLQNKKFDEALEEIDDAFNAPYVDPKSAEMLTFLMEEIEIAKKEYEFENEYEGLSKLQMWDKIYDSKKHVIDVVSLNLFLAKYGEELDAVDYSIIDKIFHDKNIKNVDKFNFFLILDDIGIDYDFKYFNSALNKEFNINPKDAEKYLKSTDASFIELQDVFMKDPSKLKMAGDLLMILSGEFFPESIPYTKEEIATSISSIINSLFEGTKPIKNDITKLFLGLFGQ